MTADITKRRLVQSHMLRTLKAMLADEAGASMVEYALIVALIAVVAIGAVTLLGKGVSGALNSAASSI